MALSPRQLEIIMHRGWRPRWIRIFNRRGVSTVFRPKGHVWHFYSMKLPIQETCIQTLVSTGQYFQCNSQSDCKDPHHHWIKQKRFYSTSCRRVGHKPWEGCILLYTMPKNMCIGFWFLFLFWLPYWLLWWALCTTNYTTLLKQSCRSFAATITFNTIPLDIKPLDNTLVLNPDCLRLSRKDCQNMSIHYKTQTGKQTDRQTDRKKHNLPS